jgi:hypothetical protein
MPWTEKRGPWKRSIDQERRIHQQHDREPLYHPSDSSFSLGRSQESMTTTQSLVEKKPVQSRVLFVFIEQGTSRQYMAASQNAS